MTINKTGDTGISQRTNVYAERKMLTHAAPHIVLDKIGLNVAMPKNKSTTIKFRRPVVFSADTIPLTEGVTPTADAFDFEDVSGTLRQYGKVVGITDVIEDTHEDPVLNEIVEQMGENIARTREALTYGVLKGGTNVFYAGSATQRSEVDSAISLNKQRAVTRALRAQKAMKVSKVLDSSVNYDTRNVEAAYVAVAHTDLEPDIRNMNGFVSTADYGNRKLICEHEIGSVEDVRYCLTADLSPFQAEGAAVGSTGMIADNSTNIDVYPVLYFGKEAFGIVALRGQGAVSPSIIPVGQKTKDDPLGQRGYAGYKMWFLAQRLNENWMARLEVGATDL